MGVNSFKYKSYGVFMKQLIHYTRIHCNKLYILNCIVHVTNHTRVSIIITIFFLDQLRCRSATKSTLYASTYWQFHICSGSISPFDQLHNENENKILRTVFSRIVSDKFKSTKRHTHCTLEWRPQLPYSIPPAVLWRNVRNSVFWII